MTKKKVLDDVRYLLVDHDGKGDSTVKMFESLQDLEERLQEIIEEDNITDDVYLEENFSIYRATPLQLKINKRFVIEE